MVVRGIVESLFEVTSKARYEFDRVRRLWPTVVRVGVSHLEDRLHEWRHRLDHWRGVCDHTASMRKRPGAKKVRPTRSKSKKR